MSRAESRLLIAIDARHVACAEIAGENWVAGRFASVPISASGESSPLARVRVALEGAVRGVLGDKEQSKLNAGVPGSIPAARPRILGIRVLVAERWLALDNLPWSKALGSRRLADPYARSHLKAAGYTVDAGDTLRIDDPPYRQPGLSVAYPATLLSALDSIARETGANLESVLPLTLAAWVWSQKNSLQPIRALAVVEGGDTSFIMAGGQSLRIALSPGDTLAANGGDRDQKLQLHWQRLCLRDPQCAKLGKPAVLDLDPPDGKSPLTGQFRRLDLFKAVQASSIPLPLQLAKSASSARHSLDAVEAATRTGNLRLAVATAVLFVAGALSVQAFRLTAEASVQESKRAAVASAAAAAPVMSSREERNHIQAVNGAIREINLPIFALLRATLPPADIHVALLSIDLAAGNDAGTESADNRTPAVKMTVEAKSAADMSQYVAYLSGRRPFTGAYLVRHEIAENEPERPYRFTVEATWQE